MYINIINIITQSSLTKSLVSSLIWQKHTFISAPTKGGWVGLGGGARILRHHQQQELDQSNVGSLFLPEFKSL